MGPRGRPPAAIPVDARPPGYPAEYERRVQLADGRAALIRPIVPDDVPALAEAIRTADADTLYRRFLGAAPPRSERLLHHLTTVDYHSRFALVALDPDDGRGVGICRYEPVEPGVAEVAVAVDPQWRRAGLASALIELLVEAALERGVHQVQSVSLAENTPVTRLESLAGPAGRQVIRGGIAEFHVALDRLGGGAIDGRANEHLAGGDPADPSQPNASRAEEITATDGAEPGGRRKESTGHRLGKHSASAG